MSDASIIGWLFVVVGSALLIGVGWLFLVARSAATWRSVEGHILTSKVESQWDTDAPLRMNYRLFVTYEYEANGQTFTGDRIAFGDSLWAWINIKKRAQWLRERYEPGDAVTVFFDPKHPTRSALWRDADEQRFYQLLTVAAILLFAGIGVLGGVIRVAG